MEAIAADDLIYCRFCRQNLPPASFMKDGQLKRMCAGCRAKRGGPRGPRGSRKKAKKAATNGAVDSPSDDAPAMIALDAGQAEQVLAAILGGRVMLDGDMILVDADALAKRFPDSADLLPLLIKET